MMEILRFNVSEDEAENKYQGDFSISPSSTQNFSESQSDNMRFGDQNDETTPSSSSTTEIPIREEKLDVSKQYIENGATITKEPFTRTKTVQVPVTHEELSIQRRKPMGRDQEKVVTPGPVTSKKQISIPIKQEEVKVSKTPYIEEEIEVKKKPVTETRQRTEDVKSEKVNISDTH